MMTDLDARIREEAERKRADDLWQRLLDAEAQLATEADVSERLRAQVRQLRAERDEAQKSAALLGSLLEQECNDGQDMEGNLHLAEARAASWWEAAKHWCRETTHQEVAAQQARNRHGDAERRYQDLWDQLNDEHTARQAAEKRAEEAEACCGCEEYGHNGLVARAKLAERDRDQFKIERDEIHELSVKLAFKLVQAGHAETLEALRDDAYAKSILNRPDMQESLRQMRDGDVVCADCEDNPCACVTADDDEIDAAEVAEALKSPDDTVPFERRTYRGQYACCGRCTGQLVFPYEGCTCVSDSLISERHGKRWCCDERTTPRQSVLDEAGELIHGDRNAHYGPPMVNFQRIAALWNAYLDDQLTRPVLPSQVGWLSMLIKVARNIEAPKRDNAVDAAGYLACAFECETDEG